MALLANLLSSLLEKGSMGNRARASIGIELLSLRWRLARKAAPCNMLSLGWASVEGLDG